MIYYIYREHMYNSLLPLNEEDVFENVYLVVVEMNSGTMKVVNMKFPLKLIYIYIYIYILYLDYHF